VYDLRLQPDTWVEFDPGARYALTATDLYTKCGWTPFDGLDVQGCVHKVMLRGQNVFEDGRVRVAPGYGRVVKPVVEP
jgi:carbamoyl-phosphate synthase/aspartate carbamoyltransferase/dihydroorotase